MAYRLVWEEPASNDWDRLDNSVRVVISKKLSKRLENPHVVADRLSGNLAGFYRMRFDKVGLRLVYRVLDEQSIVLVVAVGKRDEKAVFETATQRLSRFND